MTEEEYAKGLREAIEGYAKKIADLSDREFLEAFKELSPRKKKKIKKWVFKIIRKKPHPIKKLEVEGVADYGKH